MKIILISGLSGSGKTVALNLLEDSGFFCIDNLPLELLPELVQLHAVQRKDESRLAISIDIRSNLNTDTARETLTVLRRAGHQVDVLFLEADEAAAFRNPAAATRLRAPASHCPKACAANASSCVRCAILPIA